MSTGSPVWVPKEIDAERPNAARVYDYLLGGACNFRADREFAEKLLENNPEIAGAVRHNRAFLGRAVRFCVDQGIRQFLDLGSGVPTVGNVHEIAQSRAPGCRVVYVDHEPVAVAHSQRLLEHNRDADALLADLLDVDTVLGAEPVRRLIDFARPVAVIMTAVLHFVPDSARPHATVARYVAEMAAGSFLVLSHGVRGEQEQVRRGYRMYDQSGTPAGGRAREEIHAFMTGTEVLEPGVVWTTQWRPEFNPRARVEPAWIYAAVGRKA
ncbi:SAM-dependent methyltransferase [Actinophytocola sp.]|uniref:SAM-dependent methyltransferase n=1 Tax=Actinophytocola sp. TaxID=1872138 RepID=UPI00389A705D